MDIPPRRRIGCGRSCCARAGKVAECDHCNGPNGRHRGKSLSEPALFVQDASTHLSPHVPALAGGWLPKHLSAWPVDWFKWIGMIGNLATPNQIPSTPLAGRFALSSPNSVERQRGTAGSAVALKIVTAHSRSAQNLGEQRGVQCYAQRRGPLTLRKVYSQP